MCISNASFMAPGYKVLQTAELLLLSKKPVILSPTGQKCFEGIIRRKPNWKVEHEFLQRRNPVIFIMSELV